ncbi:MAG: HAD hydrolase-like protein [Holophagales bacterium]|nr:HAD hydrolase-like protein [Holophagales bacterium]
MTPLALDPAALLLDIDGCVVAGIERGAIPGAVGAVAELRRRKPLRFVTNTTSRSRAWMAEALGRAGFEVAAEEIVTPTALARRVLPARGDARGVLLAEPGLREDLGWFEECPPQDARAVLLATEAHDWTISRLREAVVALRSGARLYTLQQNRIFERDGRVLTDLGPVAAFLGYAADVAWENLGKPSPLLFSTLATELGCGVAALAMVGDDAEFDVAGALAAGVGAGVLLRTGKYRPGDEARYRPPPTLVLDSIADLPARLG